MPSRSVFRSGQSWQRARMKVCLYIATVGCLLVCSHPAAADISASFSTATVVNTYTWTLADLTQGATGGSVTVNRGEQIKLTYSTTVTYALDSSVGTLQGSISVTIGGSCSPTGNVKTLTGVVITVGSAAPVTVSGGGDCNPTCSNLAFGTITVNQAKVPAPGVTRMTVKALWNGAENPGCPAASIPISWGTATTKRGSATLSQTPSFPSWNTNLIGNGLTTAPTTTVSGGSVPATAPATTTVNAVDASGSFQYSWTWTIDNLLICLAPTSVGMSVQLTADDFSATKATSNTIEVKGCDQPVAIEPSAVRTQSALTFAWTQNCQPVGASSITVPWGGGGSVPARCSFTRTVASAQFTLSMNLALTNPEKGPMFINNLQLMCLWGPTITLPCGSFNNVGLAGTSGTGFVIPASQTLNCPINNLNIPGSWGVDFNQPCRIVATTYWGKATELNQFTLNFASPTVWTRINDCATLSLTCSPPTGNPRWQPIVGGGPSGTQICGVDTSTTVPDQTFSIALSGGWNGVGDQPGDCGNPVTSSCTSQITLQNSGATALGTTGGGQSSSFTITAVPSNCPTPSPPTTPAAPAPPPQQPNSQLLSTGGIRATIRVTGTSVTGAFGWDIQGSANPANQPIALGDSGKATYTISASRGNLDDAAPVKYIVAGEITVSNTNNRAVGVAAVNAVLDGAKVAADCPTRLPAQMDPGATMTCTVRLQYARGDTPGLLDAEVVQTDTAVKVAADQQAQIGFSGADARGASGACAFVNMTFAANAGMNLAKLNDVGTPTLSVDGKGVRICSTTSFQFDVEFRPAAPLTCGSQPVIATAIVTPDNANNGPVKQTAVASTITVTGCADFQGSSGARTDGRVTTESSGTSGVSVALGQVATAAVDNSAWTLRLVPSPEGPVKKARDEELANGLKFRIVYSKKTEKMTRYSGDLTITNGGSNPITVNSLTVELIDSMSPVRAVVSQVNVACPNAISSTSTLTVPAKGQQKCSYAITARMNGELVATATVVELADSIDSPPQIVKTFLAQEDEPACATLVSGLGASSLFDGGSVIAGDKLGEEEVCSSGTKQIGLPVGKTPNVACGTWQVVTIARLVPSNSTTSTPVTASAAVDVIVTGCQGNAAAPGTAAVTKLNTFKTRTVKWSIKKTATPSIAGDTLTYSSVGDNTVSVSVMYARQFNGGLTISMNGVVEVPADGPPPLVGNNKVIVIPLCGTEGGCSKSEVEATCDSTPTKGAVACRFNTHGLPMVSGAIVPMVSNTADQQHPNPAKVTLYDPNTATGRRTIGRCAVLTDQQQVTAPAKVVKTDEVNPPPVGSSVCAASWLYTYKLKFSGVNCGGQLYDFTSQAKAMPMDAAAGQASSNLNFGVTC